MFEEGGWGLGVGCRKRWRTDERVCGCEAGPATFKHSYYTSLSSLCAVCFPPLLLLLFLWHFYINILFYTPLLDILIFLQASVKFLASFKRCFRIIFNMSPKTFPLPVVVVPFVKCATSLTFVWK